MKNALPLALFAVFFSCSPIPGVAQQTAAVANSMPKVESNEDSAGAANFEAQKLYDSGRALAEAGKIDDAIDAFKRSLKIKPEDPQTHFTLGMTYSKSKSYKDAFDSFKRAVRYRPDWAEAHFRLGMMSYVLGRKSQATDEYKKLLEMNSTYAPVLHRIINDEGGNTATTSPATTPSTVASKPSTPEGNFVSAPPKTNPTSSNEHASVKKEPVAPKNTVPVSNPDPKPASPGSELASKPVNTPAPTATSEVVPKPPAADVQPATEIYRVGTGDVLDVRLLNSITNRSTLFTVIAGGLIDLPVAGGPIAVAGLTTDEIQSRIGAELSRRAVEDGSRVSVGVRQYGSHTVTVTGLVATPGTRFLRREAVPLYVVLAESQLRNDAGRVVILRAGTPGQTLDLNDPSVLNTNVVQGDLITVTGRPQEFYYIAGRINYPGQKQFQAGITLLQAILAAGGTPRSENMIEISRAGADGRLITTRFSIKEIKSGKVEDPKLEAGDRIEVLR